MDRRGCGAEVAAVVAGVGALAAWLAIVWGGGLPLAQEAAERAAALEGPNPYFLIDCDPHPAELHHGESRRIRVVKTAGPAEPDTWGLARRTDLSAADVPSLDGPDEFGGAPWGPRGGFFTFTSTVVDGPDRTEAFEVIVWAANADRYETQTCKVLVSHVGEGTTTVPPPKPPPPPAEPPPREPGNGHGPGPGGDVPTKETPSGGPGPGDPVDPGSLIIVPGPGDYSPLPAPPAEPGPLGQDTVPNTTPDEVESAPARPGRGPLGLDIGGLDANRRALAGQRLPIRVYNLLPNSFFNKHFCPGGNCEVSELQADGEGIWSGQTPPLPSGPTVVRVHEPATGRTIDTEILAMTLSSVEPIVVPVPLKEPPKPPAEQPKATPTPVPAKPAPGPAPIKR